MSPGGVSEGIGQLKRQQILQKMGVTVETLAHGDGKMSILLNALESVVADDMEPMHLTRFGQPANGRFGPVVSS